MEFWRATAVVVVVKQRGVRRRFFAIKRAESRPVDQIIIEPAVVVVVDKANTGAVGLDDELLLRHTHLVYPSGKPCLLGNVFEDDRPLVDESSRGDWSPLFVINRRCYHARRDPTHTASLLWRGLTMLRVANPSTTGKRYE